MNAIQSTIVQDLPNNILERMLTKVEHQSLHELKDALTGHAPHHTPLKPPSGSGNPRRLHKLQRAHHGNSYNELKYLFGKIKVAY